MINNNNKYMRGYILKIKKTTLLRLSFIINMLLFVILTILSIVIFNLPNMWFFSFCIFLGSHLIIKSFLFSLDSACYFGILLFCIGAFYALCISQNIMIMYPVFISMSFTCSSFFTFFIYDQQFQFFLSLSLFFVTVAILLFIIKLISIWFFLAIILIIVLLLLSKFLTLK